MALRLEVPVVYAMERGKCMLVAEDDVGETGVVVLVVMMVV